MMKQNLYIVTWRERGKAQQGNFSQLTGDALDGSPISVASGTQVWGTDALSAFFAPLIAALESSAQEDLPIRPYLRSETPRPPSWKTTPPRLKKQRRRKR